MKWMNGVIPVINCGKYGGIEGMHITILVNRVPVSSRPELMATGVASMLVFSPRAFIFF